MSRQTEMQELTRIITCSQKLEHIKSLLAKGQKRTHEQRRTEWNSIHSMALAQLDATSGTTCEIPIPLQAELPANEATPPSQ